MEGLVVELLMCVMWVKKGVCCEVYGKEIGMGCY